MVNIEDYIKAEKEKMTWLDKINRNYPKVENTGLLVGSMQKEIPDSTVIKPSLWDKLISVVLLFFMGVLWLALLSMLLNYRFPFAVILIGFLFLTFLIFLVIRNSFFNPKYIYTISIDKDGISVDDRKLFWSDIEDTFIMSRQEGKRTNYYLLIFKHDKTVDKHDLFRMGISDRKLATLIEYYKRKANA